MRKINYICNLCYCPYKPEELIGFKWSECYTTAEKLKKVDACMTKNHLCKHCAKQLREFLKDLMELG